MTHAAQTIFVRELLDMTPVQLVEQYTQAESAWEAEGNGDTALDHLRKLDVIDAVGAYLHGRAFRDLLEKRPATVGG